MRGPTRSPCRCPVRVRRRQRDDAARRVGFDDDDDDDFDGRMVMSFYGSIERVGIAFAVEPISGEPTSAAENNSSGNGVPL